MSKNTINLNHLTIDPHKKLFEIKSISTKWGLSKKRKKGKLNCIKLNNKLFPDLIIKESSLIRNMLSHVDACLCWIIYCYG